jgi:trk system potassium uptake protein TrkA
VATVIWATDQILRRLVPEGSRSEWRDASGAVQLCEMHPHKDWFGMAITELEEATGARVAFITRLGEGLIPDVHSVLQEGDLLHVTVRDSELSKVEQILARSPEAHS